MAHTELDLRERRAIEDMLNAKVPVSMAATNAAALPHWHSEQSTYAFKLRVPYHDEV